MVGRRTWEKYVDGLKAETTATIKNKTTLKKRLKEKYDIQEIGEAELNG